MDSVLDIKIRNAVRRLQKQEPYEIVHALVDPVVKRMVDDIIAHTKWGDVQDSYHLETIHYRNSVTWQLFNDSPLFNFEEVGTKAHDIPQPPHMIPAFKLIAWMEEKGIDMDWYSLIQFHLSQRGWTVHHPGTEGDHMVREGYLRWKESIQDAHRAAATLMCEVVGFEEYSS